MEQDAVARWYGEEKRRHPGTKQELGAVQPHDFERVEPLSPEDHDFDGDGQPDVVLEHGGGRNRTYYLYLRENACFSFLGSVVASPLHGVQCAGGKTHGLCDVSAAQRMIHGEALRQDYAFDGERYSPRGEPELGPRWHKRPRPSRTP